MVDNLAVLLSCSAVVFVVWRAVRMDASLPWFTKLTPRPRPDRRKRTG